MHQLVTKKRINILVTKKNYKHGLCYNKLSMTDDAQVTCMI